MPQGLNTKQWQRWCDETRGPAEDVCRYCGTHLGYGMTFMHLGLCERKRCRELARADRTID